MYVQPRNEVNDVIKRKSIKQLFLRNMRLRRKLRTEEAIVDYDPRSHGAMG